MLTTKTVWPLAFREPPRFGGGTLEDPEYRAWIVELAERGFEIAFHGATDHSSLRSDTERALDVFRETHRPRPQAACEPFRPSGRDLLGRRPARRIRQPALSPRERCIAAQHEVLRTRRGLAVLLGRSLPRSDHLRAKPLVLRHQHAEGAPIMPYHDSLRPYVRYWFSASDGPLVRRVLRAHQRAAIRTDCLQRAEHASPTRTSASASSRGGRVRDEFARLIERLAGLPGWFVPASTLLDFLRSRPGWQRGGGSQDSCAQCSTAGSARASGTERCEGGEATAASVPRRQGSTRQVSADAREPGDVRKARQKRSRVRCPSAREKITTTAMPPTV